MLSILIPTYNDDCLSLVCQLTEQATAIPHLKWEIIVGDDGSTDSEVVRQLRSVSDFPHCRYVWSPQNIGRAAIRNMLAREAQGDNLLYIDGDAKYTEANYLSSFLSAGLQCPVVYGGYVMTQGDNGNLRWRYEQQNAHRQSADKRSAHPYRSFSIANLLIPRHIMLSHLLDERFVKYGYEDVWLGKQLEDAHIPVLHIDAPVYFSKYDSNETFMCKTEESLQTLCMFANALASHSHLLQVVSRMSSWQKNLFLLVFSPAKKMIRKQLTSSNPSLTLFQVYKLGYLLELLHQQEHQS